jgi:hypothetical protein
MLLIKSLVIGFKASFSLKAWLAFVSRSLNLLRAATDRIRPLLGITFSVGL